MNTLKRNEEIFDKSLSKLPKNFKKRIIDSYFELKRRYTRSKYSDSAWDTSGLSAGKFCESVFRMIQSELIGNFTPFGKHIQNFPDECRKFITLPESAGLESLRIIIPRALVFLYTLRGKRGVGHVGGDVDANEIDCVTTVHVCDWIFCELIRIYHGLSLEESQSIIDTISLRDIPYVWEIGGKKRILRNDLNFSQKTLLLAYSEIEKGILSEDLYEWSEYSNYAHYKRDVLNKLHKEKLIEYDRESEIVYLSPTGVSVVESDILKPQNIIKFS